jgi:hypothetical protein
MSSTINSNSHMKPVDGNKLVPHTYYLFENKNSNYKMRGEYIGRGDGGSLRFKNREMRVEIFPGKSIWVGDYSSNDGDAPSIQPGDLKDYVFYNWLGHSKNIERRTMELVVGEKTNLHDPSFLKTLRHYGGKKYKHRKSTKKGNLKVPLHPSRRIHPPYPLFHEGQAKRANMNSKTRRQGVRGMKSP